MLENDPINVDDALNDNGAKATTPVTKKRPTIDRMTLGVGVLVAIAASGLYAMHHRTSLGMDHVVAADANASGIDTLLSGGRESIAALSRSMQSTRDLVGRLTHRSGPVPEAQLASMAAGGTTTHVVGRDPFRIAAVDSTADIGGAAPNANAASTNEQAKEIALAAARTLQVQSIIRGTTRRACLINGKLYFEGQTVDSFTIKTISADAVIVSSGAFKFELRLRK